jgi:hypothetical protein
MHKSYALIKAAHFWIRRIDSFHMDMLYKIQRLSINMMSSTSKKVA